jgi:hypothetical protein
MVTFLKDFAKGFDGRLNKKKRLLHERSHLAIEFPQPAERVIRTYIPLLENPQIAERGRARLNTYNLVGRAGQLFSYAGAESRKISLTFNISLLHVLETNISEGISDKFKRQFRLFFSERESAKIAFGLRKQFKLPNVGGVSNVMAQAALQASITGLQAGPGFGLVPDSKNSLANIQDPNGNGRDHASIHREYYRRIIGDITGQELEQQESESFLAPIYQGLDITTLSQGYKELNDVLDLIYVWVNLVRSTILNNSKNTLYGPPIVRLTHGPMYNNVPCLVEDYSIRILDEAGYEAQTLTPKRLEVTMNLIESRTGDFGGYEATDLEDGDNLTGWESIISNNDIDPYNGLIGAALDPSRTSKG